MEGLFKQKVLECFSKAKSLYDLPYELEDIKFDIKGNNIAGQAVVTPKGTFVLRFHPEAVKNHFNRMAQETIPHEVAHTVCQMRPELGCNHDYGWKQVCKMLGGTTERCHSMEINPKRKKYTYVTPSGVELDLGLIRHNKLQRGKVEYYVARKTKEKLFKHNYASIV